MLHFLKRAVPVVLVAAVLTTAIVNPAEAGSNNPVEARTPALRLGVAQLLETQPLESQDAGASKAPISISKDATLSLPWGNLKLTDVQLQVGLGADGSVERLRGTADMPFPTFGVLDNPRVVTPARADVGLDLGKNLSGLNLELNRTGSICFLTWIRRLVWLTRPWRRQRILFSFDRPASDAGSRHR